MQKPRKLINGTDKMFPAILAEDGDNFFLFF